MPIHPPRHEAIKKKGQLLQRTHELRHALDARFAPGKLNKAVEKYRSAQLSLLKVKVHEFQERQFQGKPQLSGLENLERGLYAWNYKTTEEIIKDFNKEF